MRCRWLLIFFVVVSLIGILLALRSLPVDASGMAQQPTVELPTVTSTPSGPVVTVRRDQEEYINVRSGPGVFFPKVGVLLLGQQAPAKGRSAGGDWILISYPGVPGGVAWVYAPFVNVSPGALPIVEPPPTPTPLFTPTIDATFAAQFIITIEPTRLPTFTPPPPLAIPTFPADTNQGRLAGVPMGFVILGLLASGIFLGLFSFTQGR
ncbi:MAG: hypothetical protein HPY45_03405 [Anaerolineae bacterium]|nr:hypothetical protein [Anaerolineae bacterium]